MNLTGGAALNIICKAEVNPYQNNSREKDMYVKEGFTADLIAEPSDPYRTVDMLSIPDIAEEYDQD